MYEGLVFLLVVDDLRTPVFLVRTLFEAVDTRAPDDWICNVFPAGTVQLVVVSLIRTGDAEARVRALTVERS